MPCSAQLVCLTWHWSQDKHLHSAEWQGTAMGWKPRGLLGPVSVKEEDVERQNKKKGNLVVPPHDRFAQHSLG